MDTKITTHDAIEQVLTLSELAAHLAPEAAIPIAPPACRAGVTDGREPKPTHPRKKPLDISLENLLSTHA